MFSPILVYIATVPYFDNNDYKHRIVDLADKPVVSDPIAPVSGQIGSEGMPETSGVFRFEELLLDPRHYLSTILTI